MSRPNPFTCPSCRATVRETRPDAKVTTLLDMYLQANPSKGRTAEEKDELKKRYTVGDQVMPKVRQKRDTSSDTEDRRMIDEVREMSLREVGVRLPGSNGRGARNRTRDGSRDSREDDARQQRRREQERRRRAEGHDSATARNNGSSSTADSRSQARQIEHQSSLRSLLSNSDIDSSEMEEEILRQIMDEGLLDGIDLNNIDISQEDELSERIADTYRQRHGVNSRSRNTRTEVPRTPRTQTTDQAQSQRRHHRRTSSAADQVARSSHPPISRPHLLEAYPNPQGQRRRTSSEHRRQTSPAANSSVTRVSSDTQRSAARSATDLSTGMQTSTSTRPRPADLPLQSRRNTDTERRRPRTESRDRTSQSAQPRSPRSIIRPAHTALNGANESQTVTPTSATPAVSIAVQSPRSSEEAGHQRTPTFRDTSREISNPASRPTSSLLTPRAPPVLYPEPSIRCNCCGTSNLEYELHEHCSICNGGNYDLCLRCYRLGHGCLYWYSFGYAARQRYMRQVPPAEYPPNQPPQHELTGHRFLRPTSAITQHPTPDNRNPSRMTPEDPAKRLQSGLFCSTCSAFANDCFWKCDVCNDGDWGFCNSCVNQSRCCTHPLLPVAHLSSENAKAKIPSSTQHSDRPSAPLGSPRRTSGKFSPSGTAPADSQYIPLTFSTNCKICTCPIQPSNSRFHCPQCSEGDYDICTSCYLKLVATGKINKSNGDKGCRRCLKGHRMVVVGFEDSPAGQRRIIVKDLVGGHTLKDDISAPQPEPGCWSWHDGQQRQIRPAKKPLTLPTNTTSAAGSTPLLGKYPPDGGVGMRFRAKWSWWPQDGVTDELAFPKGAEIREAEDINEDWACGCYAGARGLFPVGYFVYLGMVVM